jgi:hypothetical protein
MDRTSLLARGALSLIASMPLFLIACGSNPDPTGQSTAAVSGGASSDPAAPVCSGGLPDLCERCTDPGDDGCAHWVIENGKCEVQYCRNDPPPVCTGPLPDICEVCSPGNSVCAHWVVENGKCEVQICPPAVSPPPVCTGPLPDICEICSDGSSQCAHWVVQNGKCEVETCPSPVSVPPAQPAP